MSTVTDLETYVLTGRVKIGGKVREPGEPVQLSPVLHAQIHAAGNVGKDPEKPAKTNEPEPKPTPPASKPAPKATKPKGKSAAKPKAAEQPKEPAPAPLGGAGTDEQNNPPEGAPGTPAE